MSSLSLIVCTRQRPGAVRSLLKCLADQVAYPDEILVIDASDDDRTEKAVREAGCRNLRYFHVTAQHSGATRQRNFGLQRAHGTIIAFLDDDTTPAPSFFREILDCLERHPEAGGAGGYITGTAWRRIDPRTKTRLRSFRFGNWECREDIRWRLRRILRLVSSLPPGWMPEFGHPRSIRCLPPDGSDYHVESLIGCAMAFRRAAIQGQWFDPYFDGYGYFDDFEFSTRISRKWPLYLCTRAEIAHHEDPVGRPSPFRFGKMFVRYAWYVWRRRWPSPSPANIVRWWSISSLLALCRLVDVRAPQRSRGPREGMGRLVGLCTLLFDPPPVRPAVS